MEKLEIPLIKKEIYILVVHHPGHPGCLIHSGHGRSRLRPEFNIKIVCGFNGPIILLIHQVHTRLTVEHGITEVYYIWQSDINAGSKLYLGGGICWLS